MDFVWTRVLDRARSPVGVSTLAILSAYVFGAYWGAGNETMPMAAAMAHGTPFQEDVMSALI